MILDLKKLWEVCNTLSNKQGEFSEQDIFVHLLGHRSEYSEMGFEGFLNYYSFRLDGDEIVVFNQDRIPYESYSNDDVSCIPLSLLSFYDKRLESWIKTEIGLQLASQEREKVAEKENIKRQIENLNKRLNTL